MDMELLVLISVISFISSAKASDLYAFDVRDTNGKLVSLSRYRGKVSLVVNVASDCSYTDNHYRSLVQLQDQFANTKKFSVLAFPCNQFGNQEPEAISDIVKIAHDKYGLNFPIFGKVDVIGEQASPLWKYISEKTNTPPTWNFWKYLITENGDVAAFWGPWTSVDQIASEIKAAVDIATGHGNTNPPASAPAPAPDTPFAPGPDPATASVVASPIVDITMRQRLGDDIIGPAPPVPKSNLNENDGPSREGGPPPKGRDRAPGRSAGYASPPLIRPSPPVRQDL